MRVIEQNDDYTVYGFAFRYVYPTTSVQTYTLDFTTANFTGTVNDAMLQFYFVGGTASRTIYLDNVVIAKVGALAKEGVEAVPVEMPTEYSLLQNYPNPFNPVTTIRYALPEPSMVRLAVFNSAGQRVSDLADEPQEAGYHEVRFDGTTLASGVYFYRLQVRPLDSKSGAGDFVQTKRLVLVR